MALTVPIHIPPSPSSSISSSNSRATMVTVSSSSGPRSAKQTSTPIKRRDHVAFSPLRSPEDAALCLGLDLAVADLERLFSSSVLPSTSGRPPLPPMDAGNVRHRRRPPVRVAFQGVQGSYCQEAALALASASLSGDVDAFPCGGGLEGAFSALETGDADRAVVPVENSLDGPIPRNLDLLLRHAGSVQIVGEIVLPVNHCLLSLPGADASQIRRVISHRQALSHCREGLEAMGVEAVEEVDNAADAARYVAENGISDTAVIGSEMAAQEFGLAVLRRNFQDRPGSYNRFLQLGLESVAASSSSRAGEEWKTTVAFSLEKGATDMFQAMWAFESRGVKVNRIEHRPNRSSPIRFVKKEEGGNGSEVAYFDYVFVLDVEGAKSDPGVRAALARLTEIAGFVHVLGSYAMCEANASDY